MFVHVDVAVIPHRSGGVGDEFIGEAFAGLDAELRHVGHAVHFPCAALQQPMPVDRVRQRRQIVQEDFDMIALANVEQRRGHLPRKGESLEGLLIDERDARLFDVHLELVMSGAGPDLPTA